uniref:Integrase catalytic domain-containing protein n=1 Tax=Tanacetum cinerariifolium TaxID=118510 RepID=A0A6L2NTN7_TANCI|nr:hypothetical protein [Tanacetum cinerariifolium]
MQHDGLLKSTDNESFDKCVSCICGKMARKPFSHQTGRAKDLLGAIYTDFYGPFRTVSREGANYSITFTDDYSHYVMFTCLNINMRPQHNRVSERINRTLFEMVRSMMNLTNLTMSFLGYALEPAARILNMVSTKSARIPQVLDRYGFYVNVEEHKLGDHNKPVNYKHALSDTESEKWLEATNANMQFMEDNQVWRLVDLPPNGRTIRSKWLLKKTDMDGNVHTFKAHLVTQNYKVEYIAAPEVAMEAVWIRKFISGLGVVPTNKEPMKMYYDNSGAIIISNERGVQRVKSRVVSRFQQTLITNTIVFLPPLDHSRNLYITKFKMTSLADKAILSGADNRPPMLEKDMYDSWKSRMELYMLNRQHGRMILESVKNGPLLWPTVEENGVTRLKKYSELSTTEAIQADCDV